MASACRVSGHGLPDELPPRRKPARTSNPTGSTPFGLKEQRPRPGCKDG